jgi:malonate-semialdehyde dehydrogenase (acetylating)/methylmalonate-semialdehyde dehydrogenase
LISKVPQTTTEEFNEAVGVAKNAFKSWRNTPVSSRVRMLMDYQRLIRDNTEELAHIMMLEHGKTLADARGDVFRGQEVVEFCASVPTILQGETVENVATNVDLYSYRHPLGVCSGIAPFNFPAMIPLWMFPVALATGNTYILKPSERVAGAA